MAKQQRYLRAMALALLFGFVLASLPGHEVRAQERGVVVIANPSVPESVLDRRTLANIFLKKKTTWSNRDTIEIVTLTEGQVQEQFLGQYLDKNPKQYSSHWARLVFTGTGKAPRSFKDERELVSYVASVRGAIGFVGADTDIDGCKRITIEE
jgi:ABC-type phosphate transport system substrate-binding protein